MMTLPNILTLLRMALIPCFVLVFYLPFRRAHLLAAALFALAAITDWLDGYLARRLNQTSKLGAFLDPVADKLMVVVVLVILLEARHSLWLAAPVAVIIGREIAVSALREWMAEIGSRRKVAVSILGKIKTVLFGGEGLFFAKLGGPGTVWLQSLPFSRLASRVFAAAPQRGGAREEGGLGSLVGGGLLGGLLGGDDE